MTRATVSQCAVLVGGLGTRLGALTAQTPKPMLPCGDRPFLAWLLREFTRFGVTDFVLLTGHLSDVIQRQAADIQASLPVGATVTLSEEPIRAGTGGAVYHARDRLDPRFLLCNGDSLFDGNLANLLAAARNDPPDVTGRILLRRLDDASRYGVVGLRGDAVTDFLERPPPGSPGTINAGVYLFNRDLVDALSPACSLEADVMPALARAGRLRGTVAEGFFLDIGIPEDFSRAQTAIPGALRRRGLFLDAGVVMGGGGLDWAPNALATIVHATRAGWHVFVVGGPTAHAPDRPAMYAALGDAARAAGGTIDDTRWTPRPSGRDAAVADILRAWELVPERCLMIARVGGASSPIRTHHLSTNDLLAFARPLLDLGHS